MSTLETLPVHELLTHFTKPDHEKLKNIVIMRNYRGDATETGERRLRAMLGDKYDSLHHDTVACNGRVIVVLPRTKAPNAIEEPFGFRLLTAEHWWALAQVDEHSPEVTHARSATITRVPVDIAQQLHILPDLEFVDVKDVHYTEYGNKVRRKKKPAPQDVVYFRFTGGYGVVAEKP